MITTESGARSFVAGFATTSAMEQLDQFASDLRLENDKQNLVAKQSLTQLWQRHFADSAQLLTLVARDHGVWLDLGSGAGFPGMVIAALRPGMQVKLVESRRIRAEWLQRASDEMGLENCEIVHAKLELVEPFPADFISARAFAPLRKLVTIAAPFSTRDTKWLLPKGRSAAQELATLKPKQRKGFHVEPSQTDGEAGIIVGKLTSGGIIRP
ncbi:16S rRNA (guanine(527)-N(7))-methyltransferase [Alteripontixanthobacter maritimus]|uniref:Ribosomal RNA small subunit methyltransferase G n=1 Tax=Alteripontixanthobacter maritimus TaxID=2161824 RepID=A0A369Q8V1_9SPHN|nr:16S rRNA (guanine(527)-N(7))-methyltransferase RsmG [Alteripontixanthobacter maritimus]RDC61144.1 16S rRNA (guanine(527)-N(7))-methyltransferase [Alteripontixanthobacter maritimus]